MAFVETRLGRIHTRSYGEGRPLLVLNGAPGLELNCLYEPLKPLGKNRELIFFDQFGCGKDENDPKTANFEKTIQHTLALIESLNRESIGLLGHSFGSILALAVAKEIQKLTEIIFLNPIPTSWEVAVKMLAHRLPRANSDELKKIEELANVHSRKTD